jgi:hypothetical protein
MAVMQKVATLQRMAAVQRKFISSPDRWLEIYVATLNGLLQTQWGIVDVCLRTYSQQLRILGETSGTRSKLAAYFRTLAECNESVILQARRGFQHLR